MTRPWIVAVAFVLCLVVGLGAMGWISLTLLKLEKAEMTARTQAVVEENVRLALWRLDSAIAPLLGAKQCLHFVLQSFCAPRTTECMPVDRNELLLPSPLLTETPSGGSSIFQIDRRQSRVAASADGQHA